MHHRNKTLNETQLKQARIVIHAASENVGMGMILGNMFSLSSKGQKRQEKGEREGTDRRCQQLEGRDRDIHGSALHHTRKHFSKGETTPTNQQMLQKKKG